MIARNPYSGRLKLLKKLYNISMVDTDKLDTIDVRAVDIYVATLEGSHRQWALDILGAGHDWVPAPYHGRNMYQGPAVRVDEDELQDVIRASCVRVVWDQMGKHGLVIYPG